MEFREKTPLREDRDKLTEGNQSQQISESPEEQTKSLKDIPPLPLWQTEEWQDRALQNLQDALDLNT